MTWRFRVSRVDERSNSVLLPRQTRFWVAGALAFALVLISWINHSLVKAINVHLLHVEPVSVRGWWVYVLLRLGAVFLLLWTIFRQPNALSQQAQPPSLLAGSMFDPLLGLRALACLLVLMGHYFLVVSPFTPIYPHPGAGSFLIGSPWSGVWLFFTLSGFLMGKAFTRRRYQLDADGMRRFLRNRFLRLLPIFFMCVVLLCIYRYPEMLHPRNWWMLLSILSFDYRGDLPIGLNTALWSVSTEMQFYFLVPMLMVGLLLLRQWLGRGIVLLPFLLLLTGRLFRLLILHRVPHHFAELGYTPLIPNLDLFLTGMSLNLLPRPEALPDYMRKSTGTILLFASFTFYLLIAWFSRHALNDLEYYWAVAPLPCALFAACFIYLAELRGQMPRGTGLAGRWKLVLQWAGTLTYCIYVFHPDILLSIATTLPPAHSLAVSLAWFPLSVLLVVAVAAFFYFAVEKPFDLKKRVSGTELADAP